MNNNQSSSQSGGSVVSGGTMPMVQQTPLVVEPKKSASGLIKTIVIIILSLISVTFIGLFIWVFLQYKDVQEKADYNISVAVAKAKDEQSEQDTISCENQKKEPLQTFSGPANPIQVNTVSKDTINALRVSILNDSYEDVVAKYRKEVEKTDAKLTVQSVVIGNAEKGTEVAANRYTGTIPGTDLSGFIVIFKIRDKTVIMQTDSVLFEEDFDALLRTVTFNK